MKKVALYNPYLSTKGGGEKVCLALADSLQHTLGCSVYLVSHGEVDLDDLASYFKLDLSGIQVVQIDYDSLFYKILARVPLPGRPRAQNVKKQRFRHLYKQLLPKQPALAD
jgi:hypothetical protein